MTTTASVRWAAAAGAVVVMAVAGWAAVAAGSADDGGTTTRTDGLLVDDGRVIAYDADGRHVGWIDEEAFDRHDGDHLPVTDDDGDVVGFMGPWGFVEEIPETPVTPTTAR